MCFTGKAKKTSRCDLCLSAGHRTDEYSLVADDNPGISRQMKAVESAVVAFSSAPKPGGGSRGNRSQDICRLFNAKRCNFRNCKYRHACRGCGGPHAALECPKQPDGPSWIGPGPMRQPRSQTGARMEDSTRRGIRTVVIS